MHKVHKQEKPRELEQGGGAKHNTNTVMPYYHITLPYPSLTSHYFLCCGSGHCVKTTKQPANNDQQKRREARSFVFGVISPKPCYF
jgi:hypothetical protein